ncbi:alpha/beta fold hydrolase [Jidongwangia harbinensis]|uniref:alpha/beta fold hydrolase n=1 Tax=Jidongwangia harbinensis TaxID=2878561 RepID=UPI001CD997C8|nr:alpha/beta hydrolase [Jidongwangia harbinensis]MCA2218807.1 alpha/beta hydrolase [Jidongwangia harbinensis]
MFDRFTLTHVDVGPATLRVRYGGDGPPVVLLHGHPRTHVTWHRVADALVSDHTVICPDLRGYGRSSKPPAGDDFSGYGKRAMAGDVLALMRELGHDRFAVAGHDRGSAVALRLTLDHPAAVTHAAFLDGLPISEHLGRIGVDFARQWWHWFFFAQTEKPAERVISADPDAWYRFTDEHMGAEAFADLRAAVHDPATVHAMVCDYRAGVRGDWADERADRAAGRRVTCPVLVAWSTRDDLEELYGDPVAVWRAWADDVVGVPIESGHHMAEENPEAVTAALRDLLRR